jgi:integrase
MTGDAMTLIKLKYCYSYKSRGVVRFYVRLKKGGKSVRIKGEPGSAEFMKAYQLAIDPSRTPPATTGTLWALAVEFFESPKFVDLKPNSQKIYRSVIERVSHRVGDFPIRSMPRSVARKIIAEIGAERKGMANLTLSVMKKVFNFAMNEGLAPANPFQGLDRFKLGEHHTWTDQEITIFEGRWTIGTRQRLALAVLLYTGQRGGDCVRIKRSDIRSGVVHVVQQKTGTELDISIHPELDRIIRATPAKGIYLLGDAAGRPISQGALSKFIERSVKAAGLPRRCVAHGLRKAIMRQLAEHGASTKELKAVSGHKSLAQVELYTEAADQGRLNRSAMARLGNKDG